ncbi:MAG: GGDEF domain-containing protein [Gemmatimonadetes bacterium]|nr:GGDEF domain-containing protein [Gemmatimonadota bacterium]
MWPGAILFLTGVWFAAAWGNAEWFSQAVPYYAPVVFGIGLLLAWRFGRSRVSAVLVGLALLNYLPGSELGGATAGSPWEAGGIILLVLIGALSVLKDHGVFSRFGIVQPLIVAAGVSASWALIRSGRSWVPSWAWQPILPGGLAPWSGLSDATVLAGIASLALTLAMGSRRDHPMEKGLFWVLVATLVAVAQGAGSDGSTFYLMVAGLILHVVVLETSHAMAFRDELTGLPARRSLWRELDSAGRLYAVGMVDIDHFKKFNDEHGHDIGDQVLRLVGSCLGRVTGGGKAFRYGGEEFAIVFPGKDRDHAYGHLEVLRKTIEESEFTVRRLVRRRRQSKATKTKKTTTRRKQPTVKLSVTVSIGVAERSKQNPTDEAVVKAADRALFRAKKKGRNRVAR